MHQLQHIAAELAPVVAVQSVLDSLRVYSFSMIGGRGGYIVLADWDARTFERVEAYGAPVSIQPVPAGSPLDTDSSWSKVLIAGNPDFTSEGNGSTAVLPLPSREGARGLLVVESADAFDEDQQAFLISLTGLVGQALDRAFVQESLNQTQAQMQEQHQETQTLDAELRGYTLALTRNVGEPIRRIRDFLKVVEQRLEPNLDDRTRQLFGYARLEADGLADRVGELRNLALIDTRELKFERVDLNQLLVQVRHDLEPLTLGRKVQWQVETLPVVEADALLFWQVLVELLGFMLEDSLDQLQPVIGVEGQKVDGHVLLQFWDQGKGFDQQVAERMFDVLDRSVPRSSRLARLGLSNVRRVVNRHGGRIWAEGRPGGGARFFVSLPITRRARIQNDDLKS